MMGGTKEFSPERKQTVRLVFSKRTSDLQKKTERRILNGEVR